MCDRSASSGLNLTLSCCLSSGRSAAIAASNLDIDETPPEPRALIERYGTELDLPDGIVVVGKRILEASVRLFTRGMVSDAVAAVAVEDAGELAGAALLAACRINDVDVNATDIAAAGEFEPRALYDWLETLDETVDGEIPRLDAEAYVDRLVETLDLDETVRKETLRALEQYQPRPDDPEHTAPELAAGAMAFAATVGGTAVDPAKLSEAGGADPEFVSETGNAIALAKTYDAGRESQPVDGSTSTRPTANRRMPQ
ncbi:MAG: hypothetical protein V5A34_12090 [Halapricum sp.]